MGHTVALRRTEVDGGELLREREESCAEKCENAHSARREHGGADCDRNYENGPIMGEKMGDKTHDDRG